MSGRSLLSTQKPAVVKAPSSAGGLLQRRSDHPASSAIPPVVYDVLRAPGSPFDPSVRGFMEGRFGQDFSGVRVHTDDMAARSAQALNAQAYTVAPHVVFGRDAYAPHRLGGHILLAHELTHVVQQGNAHTARGELRIDPPGSAGETEAERTSREMLTVPSLTPVSQHHHAPMLSRSLLGAGIGGGLGAAGLGAAGAAIGGTQSTGWGVFGGIAGGLIGLGLGGWLGELASRRSRHLTADEKTYAHEIFLDSINYDVITITRGSISATGATRTTQNTINFEDPYFDKDTLNLTSAGQLTLIHEMGHVWQYQNAGLAYIPSSLIPQAVAASRGMSRNAAYNWRDSVANRIPWQDWGAEDQAECISDYNEALRRINGGEGRVNNENLNRDDFHTVSLAEPYIDFVRHRVGAVGSGSGH